MAESERAAGEAIPLTVLTGFLGAGKTTLLNRILTGDHGLRIAVLVNDFGSINIDADLVAGVESDGDIISLANGCVCCNVRDDLISAVMQMMERPEQPEYIVLEASGVAEPSSIALTFLDDGLRDRIRLDSIMCVVDAEQVFAAPEMMELKLRQIAFADMLILNKVDLVTPDEIERIKAWLDDRFHRIRLVEACGGDVPLEILLSVGRFDPAQLDTGAARRPRRLRVITASRTITRRCSGRGATRPTNPSRWRRCRSPPAACRRASTDARASSTRSKHQDAGRSSRSSASASTSHPEVHGTTEDRAPGWSSSAETTASTKRRCATSSTTVGRAHEPAEPAPDHHSDGPANGTKPMTVTNTPLDELGPVDYLIIEFPPETANFTGEMAEELIKLVDTGTIRIIDLLVLVKDQDGEVEALEIEDLEHLGPLQVLEADLAELLAADDVEHLAAAMEPGSVAGVLIFENVWAAPFSSAARRAGGQLIANGRIPIQAIIASVEADEAFEPEGD